MKLRQNFPVIRFGWYRDSSYVWNLRVNGDQGEHILDVLYKVQ
jgi:hypothetical protein